MLRHLFLKDAQKSQYQFKGHQWTQAGPIRTCLSGTKPDSNRTQAFALQEGDAHVIRNAGGRAKDALRSLIISQLLLGTKHVVILHHTDCGMRTFS